MTESTSTARAKYRDRVTQYLIAGVSAVEGRVYRARVWPLKLPELPALLVYGYDEEKKRANMDGGRAEYSVSCTMAIMGRVSGVAGAPDAVEASLELLAGQIEATLLRPDHLTRKGDGIEAIAGVRTTLKVEIAGERCNGELMVALDMQWMDIFLAPEPDIVCEEPFLAIRLPNLP
jgi:hypothetical protein